jgi:hypothetical protein
MELTFERLRDDHLCMMFWAFEPNLFDPDGGKASCAVFGANIAQSRK